MKALLMHRDRDFDLEQELPCNESPLMQDLELGTLLGAMADGDAFLLDVAQEVLLSGLQNDADTVLYRQAAVKDCLKNPAVVRALYDLAVEAIGEKRKRWLGIFSHHPGAVLHGAIDLMQMFAGFLRRLRDIAREHAGQFESEAFSTLFATLEKELSDEYLASIEEHLKQLKFPAGIVVSAELGRGNEGRNYVLTRL